MIHQAFTRNLQLTSDFKLAKGGAEAEPEGDEEPAASSSSKAKKGDKTVPPEWALQSSKLEQVKVEPQWEKLLSNWENLNKAFWLKSRVGVCLDSLASTVPEYTSKDLMILHRQNQQGVWKDEVWTLKPFGPQELVFAPLVFAMLCKAMV